MELNIDPRKALAMGALAADLLRPQRVRDLESFLAANPHVVPQIEAALGFGHAPDMTALASLFSPMGPEVMDEQGADRPEPGPDAQLF